jgi:hypothetical protein
MCIRENGKITFRLVPFFLCIYIYIQKKQMLCVSFLLLVYDPDSLVWCFVFLSFFLFFSLFSLKFTVSFLSNSPLIFHHNSTDYNKYLLSQTNAFPPGKSILSSTVCDRLSSSTPPQTFQTQNRAGLYQLCSN